MPKKSKRARPRRGTQRRKRAQKSRAPKKKPARAKPAKDKSGPERQATVQVAAAKGRPMLTWVGKRPLMQVTAFPAQLVERHDALNILGIDAKAAETYEERMKVFRSLREHWNAECWDNAPSLGVPCPESGGILLHGDNKECLAYLLAHGYRGKVDLIYIDPPFDSGADYIRKVALRGAKGGVKVEGETYTLGEQIQYTDIWAKDNYLQFMYERLLLLKEFLATDGSIYVHCDYRKDHHLRCLMDEVFGAERLQNEIIWFYPRGGDSEKQFNRKHDTILFYAKGETWQFNYQAMLIPYTPDQLSRFEHEDEVGRYYWNVNPRGERGKTYLRKGGIGEYDVWNIGINAVQIKEIGYPTLKPEALLERVIKASSVPGDLVLDCFLGAGTTAAVAQKLGRRWIGCDINKGASQTTVKRLRTIIGQQIKEALAEKKKNDRNLPGTAEESDQPRPAQFGFTVWRVNDYDLQIQHNEAVALACEHIGVQRIRTDSFFDGTRGKALVKIIPFDHPLSPLDLEELKRELDARPDEDRGVILVCLGMELAAKAWVDNWNRLRKGRDAVNRIDVIELRTDPKYGKFLVHAPARAKMKVTRKGDRIHVEIEDFISPTIIERLNQQAGLVQPKIDGWRVMVDSVMIDTAYDGQVFNAVLADIPAKKTDLVGGTYDLPAPEAETTVAVKITDMLGEEVLTTQRI